MKMQKFSVTFGRLEAKVLGRFMNDDEEYVHIEFRAMTDKGEAGFTRIVRMSDFVSMWDIVWDTAKEEIAANIINAMKGKL